MTSILFSINKEDQKVSSAVNASIPQISKFIEEKIWETADSDALKITDCFSDEFESYFVQINDIIRGIF